MRTNAPWVKEAKRTSIEAESVRQNLDGVRQVTPAVSAEVPTFLPPRSHWIIRVYWWFFGALFGKARLSRWGQWWWSLPIRGWSFVQVMVSAKVSDAVYRERMAACGTCKANTIRVHPNHGPRSYCGLCGCPDWPLAELKVKNRKSAWHCPRRRHKGPYPEDAWIAKLPESQRENMRAQLSGDSNCKGCGKGGA